MDRMIQVLLGVIIALLVYHVFLAPIVLIDVEIYEMENGSFIYCATGSLTEPPARYVGSGAVPKGDESYC